MLCVIVVNIQTVSSVSSILVVRLLYLNNIRGNGMILLKKPQIAKHDFKNNLDLS